jgi:hypothetical protein
MSGDNRPEVNQQLLDFTKALLPSLVENKIAMRLPARTIARNKMLLLLGPSKLLWVE